MIHSHSIFTYSASYLFFFVLLWISKAKKGIRLLDENGPVKNRNMLFVLHTSGILFLGIIPMVLSDHRPADILLGKSVTDESQIIITGLLTILMMAVSPVLANKKYRQLAFAGSIHCSLSTSFVSSYFIIRILFICFYEMWFRGYLLFDCISIISIPAAILLNIFLYALLHAVNGKVEWLACIPFGLVICSLSIWTGGVWPAILLHLALTIPYENRLVKMINKPSNFFI